MTHTILFLIGLVAGALIAFLLTLNFAGKLQWLLGFAAAEKLYRANLEHACAENELLKMQMAKMSTDLTDLQREQREVQRYRKLYIESCRDLANAKSAEFQHVHALNLH